MPTDHGGPPVGQQIAERATKLGLRITDVLERTGDYGGGGPISRATWHGITTDPDRLTTARARTLRKLDHALEWELGTIERMRAGDGPELPPEPIDLLERLEETIDRLASEVRELRESRATGCREV